MKGGRGMSDAAGCAGAEEGLERYAATVVSVQHGEYAVLDGGSKTFATDIPLNTPPFYYPGYAAVDGSPDLCLSQMNEEHGILTAAWIAGGIGSEHVIRAMPHTPAPVRKGLPGLFSAPGARDPDRRPAASGVRTLGRGPRVEGRGDGMGAAPLQKQLKGG